MTGPAIRELEAPRRNWMIPLILVALALLAIPVLRGLRRPKMPSAAATPQVTAPVPAAARARGDTAGRGDARAGARGDGARAPRRREPGTIEDMAAYLAGTGETTPHAFAPSPLNFAFGSAVPTPESTKTLDEIADAAEGSTRRRRSGSRATPTTIGTPGVEPEPVAGARGIDQERARRPRRRRRADRDRGHGPGPSDRVERHGGRPSHATGAARSSLPAGSRVDPNPVNRPATDTSQISPPADGLDRAARPRSRS